jgi:hypothetical protein
MKQIFINGVSHSIEAESLTFQELADLARIPNAARISYVMPMRGSTRGGGVVEPGATVQITSAMNFIILAQEP